MRVKSSGLARGLTNARPPGSAPFANAPTPGLTWRANAGGSWALVELTDALNLHSTFLRVNGVIEISTNKQSNRLKFLSIYLH